MKPSRHLFHFVFLGLACGLLMIEARAQGVDTPAAPRGPDRGQQVSMQQPSATPTRDGQTAADRLRSQISDRQRDSYRACNRALEKLRSRSLDVAAATAAKSLNMEAIRRNLDQIRDQLAVLDRNCDRFRQSLTPEQRTTVHERMWQISHLRRRIENHLNAINQTIASPEFDRHRLIVEARLAERTMRAYHLHFHEMADQLGMNAV